MSRFIRIGDAARQLGVSVDTVRRWADDEKITAYRSPGGQLQFLESDVRRLHTVAETRRASVSHRQDQKEQPPAEDVSDVMVDSTQKTLRPTRESRAPDWHDLPPWEQHRREVEADLAIDRLYEERDREKEEEQRDTATQSQIIAERARLAQLKQHGKMWCFELRFEALVIRELERFVTSNQVPSWIPIWEQQRIVADFVQRLVREARERADSDEKRQGSR
jgi:excisionase family DNA binding protein